MRDPLALSADKLRVQAIVACSVCLLAASALPVVAYVYVLRFSTTALGPFAWTHWAIVGATCLLGIAAHSLNRRVLLALHVAMCCMLGAALGGFDTAFWYQLTTRCLTYQAVFKGCQQCPCANTNTCTAANLANDVLCQSCTAYPTEVCKPALQTAQNYVIAFTGLAAVLFLAVPAFYSLLVLCRMEASTAVAAARRQMVSFAVDQQATMVESNEKPNVTPAMLSAWVSFLFSTHDPDCVAIGERCRTVLSGRGFELDVKNGPAAKKSGKIKRQATGRPGSRKNVVASSSSSAGVAPEPEELSAAEAGRPVPTDRRVQFMVQ